MQEANVDEVFVETDVSGETETLPDADYSLGDGTSYLDSLVGEGKKFKTTQDLAKGKLEADRYIHELKAKIDSLTKEVNTRSSLEDFKVALEEMKKPHQGVEYSDEPEPSTQKSETSLTQLESLVESLLSKKEQQSQKERNTNRVLKVLEENFGGKASEVITTKARSLGMSVKDLQDLAQRAPQAFFSLVGATEGQQRPSLKGNVPTSTMISEGLGTGVRSKSYYDKLKVSNPKLYNDPRTTSQMISDMKKLGREAFYNS